MIIIVDGYNVLKHRNPEGFIEDKVRQAFLHMMARYGRRKKHKIVVIFDGGPYHWPHKEKVAGIAVIFSGDRESADEVIMQYLEDHQNKDLLLVSSDHELNLFASSRDIVSIGSEEFNYLVKVALEANGEDNEEPNILIDEQETDLDAIMQQATQHVMPKDEDTQKKELHLISQYSKNDKKLMKKLKKL
jgi:predicted RNA-binding protein with PIN domain